VKETVGKAFGDKKLEAHRKTDEAAGKVQNAIGELKDAVRGNNVAPQRRFPMELILIIVVLVLLFGGGGGYWGRRRGYW
jgi:uncharacterized protein YjbJ (UPF0337 family)